MSIMDLYVMLDIKHTIDLVKKYFLSNIANMTKRELYQECEERKIKILLPRPKLEKKPHIIEARAWNLYFNFPNN